MNEIVIHKLVTSNKRCKSYSYQLCEEKNNSAIYNGFKQEEWKEFAKFNWRYVTCPVCLKMREGRS